MTGLNNAGTGTTSDIWKAAWQHAAFRFQLLVTVPILVGLLLAFSRFLDWVELRPGIFISDPIVAAIPPHDFTWPIFLCIYSGLIYGLVLLSRAPFRLLAALQAYVFVVVTRILAMYSLPLEPPAGLIPLADPFVQAFGSGFVPTKDLFFSGHTATLVLLALSVPQRSRRMLFALLATLVALMILWQHVHYTVDVLMAPFVVFACHRSASAFHNRTLVSGGSK
jgi:hypothetical protein